jgi:hypothetical protein
MDEVGAALVDRVLPNVPARQWVLSLPWELRLVCVRHAELMTAVVRTFWSAPPGRACAAQRRAR